MFEKRKAGRRDLSETRCISLSTIVARRPDAAGCLLSRRTVHTIQHLSSSHSAVVFSGAGLPASVDRVGSVVMFVVDVIQSLDDTIVTCCRYAGKPTSSRIG